jgi:hypothetical protein
MENVFELRNTAQRKIVKFYNIPPEKIAGNTFALQGFNILIGRSFLIFPFCFLALLPGTKVK